MTDLVVWIALLALPFGYEAVGVWDDYRHDIMGPADRPHPLTYWVRTAMRDSRVFKIALLAAWLWLGFHFFVERG